ncbi:MAG: hypothetical protein LAN84_15420 [Acidobacteriia bacterium]|nr:hypothetical protein [Terriglobia bacterium]
MAPDDRESRSGEERFEKMLARHLRRNAPSTAGSGVAAACPDAETLAAFQERSLSAQETDTCKQHIAACARCREILAALEATQGIALGVADEKPVTAGKAPVPGREMRRKRGIHWAWLAPAGALAAGLLLWVAVHEKRPAFVEGPPPVIVAENRGASTPVDRSAVTRENAAGVLDQAQPAAKSAPQEKVDRSAATNKTERDDLGYVGNAAPPAAARAEEAASADKKQLESAARSDAFRGKAAAPAAVGGLENRLEKSQAMKDAPAPAAEPARVQATEQEEAKIAAKAAPAAPPVDTETFSRETAPKQKSEAAGLAAAAPAVLAETVSGARKKESLQRADALHASKRIIAAPGGKVQWSVGPGGAILRSADGGKSWAQQASGVTAELLAGSAPSESVCWVVGRQGTVLLTTDGEHWTKIAAPTTADLTGVAARDARSAAVWSETGRPRYLTEDAGGAWASAPLD